MSQAGSATEDVDPRYCGIEEWSAQAMVDAMIDGQASAIEAVRACSSALAAAADAAAERLGDSGRLIYIGAGTSGRLGVLDGVELIPTFGWPEARLAHALAGGDAAMLGPVEGAEDDTGAARTRMAEIGPGANDVAIAIAASGRTPYAIAALKAAGKAGAMTIAIANNPDSALLAVADFALAAPTGAEVIAGSTRMKAGTAQKAILNVLSTTIMLRMGRVYRGQMVHMALTNDKLRHRARLMVSRLAECDEDAAAAALAKGGEVRAAVLIASGLNRDAATALLEANGGNLHRALNDLDRRPA